MLRTLSSALPQKSLITNLYYLTTIASFIIGILCPVMYAMRCVMIATIAFFAYRFLWRLGFSKEEVSEASVNEEIPLFLCIIAPASAIMVVKLLFT